MNCELILEPTLTLVSTAFAAILLPISSVLMSFISFPAETTAIGLGISALVNYCDSKNLKNRKLKVKI